MCIFIKKGYVIIYDSFSRIAVLVNIGIPVEGDEGFDEDTSYQLMDKIANDPMRYIYVSEVLNWWVNTLFWTIFDWVHHESVDMLQLARSVLYVPPTQTAAESAFSTQKWMLSGRRATMTPSNCNMRMVGRSCKRLKRQMQEAQLEIKLRKRQKIEQSI